MNELEKRALMDITQYLIETEYISLLDDLKYDNLSSQHMEELRESNDVLFAYCVDNNISHIWIDAYRLYKYQIKENYGE